MRRRNLILILGLLAVVPLGTAQAQQSGKVYRIVIAHASALADDLTEGSRGSIATPAILKALRRSGYIEGQNLLIERYSGEGRASHYPDLARDVVRLNPDLIIAIGNKLVLDLKAATSTIPIVGVFGQPVEEGIVPSLARPGGNITGVSDSIGWEQWGKRVQLLKQMVPQATRSGVVEPPEARDQPNAAQLELFGLTRIGPPLKRPLDETEYRRLFATLAQEGAEAILVTDHAENTTNLRLVIELAEKGRLPAMYPYRHFVEAGGLMSYGVDLRELGGRAADMADRILKGAKPPEIPVLLPTKFELAINLKTAKALGLTVPPELLAIADAVIE
jgi:putative tryptophan/tyrosine transport system substrate-binding protein